MLGKSKLNTAEFLNIPQPTEATNLVTRRNIDIFSCTKGFLTIACPDLLNKFKFGMMDKILEGRKRASTEDLNLGDSSESLSSSPDVGRNLFKKLVKLREKIIANENLNLKKRFAPKRKRAVSFADDKGLPLEDVCVVEKHDVDDDVILAKTQDDTVEKTDLTVTPWITAFFQPIFDKRKMKRIFSQTGVVLETVDVEDTGLSGTINVDRNVAVSRRNVFVRYTKDSWKTYSDVTAKAVPVEMDRSRSETEAIYTFELAIPESALHIQFAVCLADASGKGQWDDNEGQNYILLHHSCLNEEGGSDSDSDTADDNTKL